jgi:hypothetical protein
MAHGGDARGDGKYIVMQGSKHGRIKELIFRMCHTRRKNLRKTL